MRGLRTYTSVVRTPCMPCNSLATAFRALQQHCVLKKSHKNRKENENFENLVFDVSAALGPCIFVRQSCGVVHNILNGAWIAQSAALFKCSCTGMYHWFDCHLPGAVVSQGISQPDAENCSGFPPPLDSRRLRSRIA